MSVLKQFKISLDKKIKKLWMNQLEKLKWEKSAKLDAQTQIFAILSRKIQIKLNIY